ncbi:lytic transglycosylase domain-containing protein [Trichlorobacter ammonificans]|uniref:Transglycosylase SLT domain-containing protein n=1 Tax=Trichlorobacter ammonificans TaxID=2916410 RepID=A0ABN8HMX6_9BACT|nr:lytic transglycosylase domain-containing protein [Trichlorobacter ammonificans]CAH2031382.1 protein of unknown function [Trichlorobacter ammonificans]
MKIIVLVGACLALPSLCGSGEYSWEIRRDTVVETRGGRREIRPRSLLSQRIESFVRRHGAAAGSKAAQMAELLSRHRHGTVLAAIAARESGFDIQARGRAGEVGAYQVRPNIWGDPGETFGTQTEKAGSILRELLAESNGSLALALERYNGRGQRAKAYASSVLALAAGI